MTLRSGSPGVGPGAIQATEDARPAPGAELAAHQHLVEENTPLKTHADGTYSVDLDLANWPVSEGLPSLGD